MSKVIVLLLLNTVWVMLCAGCTATGETVVEPEGVVSQEVIAESDTTSNASALYEQMQIRRRFEELGPQDLFSPAQYRDKMTPFYVEQGIRVDRSFISLGIWHIDLTKSGMGDTVSIMARTVEGQAAEAIRFEGDSTYVHVAVYPGITWAKVKDEGFLLFNPDILNANAYAEWKATAAQAFRASPYIAWKNGAPRSQWKDGWRELYGLTR